MPTGGRWRSRSWLSSGGVEVWRVGLNPEKPNVIVSLPVPASETRTPLPIFAALPQLAQSVLARGAGH